MTLYTPQSKTGLLALVVLDRLLASFLPALFVFLFLGMLGGGFAWISGGEFINGALFLAVPVTAGGYLYFVITHTKYWYRSLSGSCACIYMTIWKQTLSARVYAK